LGIGRREQSRLRFLSGTSGSFRLGLLSGDTITVQGFLSEEIKGGWRKREFVLRQRQAAVVPFHGKDSGQAGCWSAGK
jgi:hypothetical protein